MSGGVDFPPKIEIMPTVLRKNGFRFHFYFADEFEPPHIHVEKGGNNCKFWLQPVGLSRNEGFKQHELNKIFDIIEANHERLVGEWRARFGHL